MDTAGQMQVQNGPVKVGIQPVLGRLYEELTHQKADWRGMELQVALFSMARSQNIMAVEHSFLSFRVVVQRPHDAHGQYHNAQFR